MAWLNIRLTVAAAEAEHLSDWLSSQGAVAVTAADAGDEPILEPGPADMPLWPQVRIDALFPLTLNPGELRAGLCDWSASRDTEVPQFDVDFIEDQDWSSTWRDGLDPQHYRGRLHVLTRDAATPDEPGAILRLDPGLAFGTGTHATTALCLDWLAQQDIVQSEVLDYGCGSGILAIAALLLGAGNALAVDHDPQALVAARDNARANGVGDRQLTVVAPGPDLTLPDGHFDVVMANILANPLIDLASELTAALKPGGRMVLSGILDTQWRDVTGAYPDIEFDPPCHRDGWVRLSGVRREAPDGHEGTERHG